MISHRENGIVSDKDLHRYLLADAKMWTLQVSSEKMQQALFWVT